MGVGSGRVQHHKDGRILLVIDKRAAPLEPLARQQGAGFIPLIPPCPPARRNLGNQHLLLPRRQTTGKVIAIRSIARKVSPVPEQLEGPTV